MSEANQTLEQLPPRAEKRLAALIAAGKYIPFEKDLPDKEFAYIKCSIYGATDTNELFVKLANGQISFVEAIPSALIHPPMADRRFGMDVIDSQVAFALAEQMWVKYRGRLIREGIK